MTTAVQSQAQATETIRLERYLGPARVVRLEEESVVVVIDGAAVVHATLALAFPYRPVIGDQLLLIGDEQAFYVIGVLEARGRSDLSCEGGVALRAESGRLRLTGDRGVRVRGKTVHLETKELKTVAIDATQNFGEQRKQVRGEIKTEAGQIDELSQGPWLTQAKRFILKTLNEARVKSNTVRLG